MNIRSLPAAWKNWKAHCIWNKDIVSPYILCSIRNEKAEAYMRYMLRLLLGTIHIRGQRYICLAGTVSVPDAETTCGLSISGDSECLISSPRLVKRPPVSRKRCLSPLCAIAKHFPHSTHCSLAILPPASFCRLSESGSIQLRYSSPHGCFSATLLNSYSTSAMTFPPYVSPVLRTKARTSEYLYCSIATTPAQIKIGPGGLEPPNPPCIRRMLCR